VLPLYDAFAIFSKAGSFVSASTFLRLKVDPRTSSTTTTYINELISRTLLKGSLHRRNDTRLEQTGLVRMVGGQQCEKIGNLMECSCWMRSRERSAHVQLASKPRCNLW
jgi:hypothetical protein